MSGKIDVKIDSKQLAKIVGTLLLSDFKQAFVEAIREELTSGDASVRQLLKDILFSAVLKDGSGSELSGYVKNIDVKLSDVKASIEGVQTRVARLQIFSSSKNAWMDVVDALPISIESDSVGLARDSTISKLVNALQSVGRDRILTVPDNPPNLDVKLSDVKSSIESVQPRKIVDASGNDLSGYIKNLDVKLSTLATEATLSKILDALSDFTKSIEPVYKEESVKAGADVDWLSTSCSAFWGFVVCADGQVFTRILIDGKPAMAKRFDGTNTVEEVVVLPRKIRCSSVTLHLVNEAGRDIWVRAALLVEK